MRKSRLIMSALISMSLNWVHADCPSLTKYFDYYPSYGEYVLKHQFNHGGVDWSRINPKGSLFYTKDEINCIRLVKVTAAKKLTGIDDKNIPTGIGHYKQITCEYSTPLIPGALESRTLSIIGHYIKTLPNTLGGFSLVPPGWEEPYFQIFEGTHRALLTICHVTDSLIPQRCSFLATEPPNASEGG